VRIKWLSFVLLLLLSTVSLAAPNYQACNLCHIQEQNNPMLNCSEACKGIGVHDIIPRAKTDVPPVKGAPLETAAGCRACHLCRVQAANAYDSTNCIDQCSSCRWHNPFESMTGDSTKGASKATTPSPAPVAGS